MGGKHEKNAKPARHKTTFRYEAGPDMLIRVYPDMVKDREELGQYNELGEFPVCIVMAHPDLKPRHEYSVYYWVYRNGTWSDKPMPLTLAYLPNGLLSYVSDEIKYATPED